MATTLERSRVLVVDPLRDPAWAQLVGQRPTSVFCSPAWLQVLHDTYGIPLGASVLFDGVTPEAGMVYAEVDDVLGRRLVSLPFSDFCDPIVRDAAAWDALVGGLLRQGCPVEVRCLENTVPLGDDRFSLTSRAHWHDIDLDRDIDDIWDGLHGSARRAIRKARDAGVEIRHAENEKDLRSFFELHLRIRRSKYGLLAQPYAFFRNIWDRFVAEGNGTLILALIDDTPVAGCLFLRWQDVLYYKFNASDPAHLAQRPNDRVLWEGICYAHSLGLRAIDFGATAWEQDGLAQYKRKYATGERQLSVLQHLPDGLDRRRDEQARALLRDLTTVLVADDVPVSAVERAGDVLYRYFA